MSVTKLVKLLCSHETVAYIRHAKNKRSFIDFLSQNAVLLVHRLIVRYFSIHKSLISRDHVNIIRFTNSNGYDNFIQKNVS